MPRTLIVKFLEMSNRLIIKAQNLVLHIQSLGGNIFRLTSAVYWFHSILGSFPNHAHVYRGGESRPSRFGKRTTVEAGNERIRTKKNQLDTGNPPGETATSRSSGLVRCPEALPPRLAFRALAKHATHRQSDKSITSIRTDAHRLRFGTQAPKSDRTKPGKANYLGSRE